MSVLIRDRKPIKGSRLSFPHWFAPSGSSMSFIHIVPGESPTSHFSLRLLSWIVASPRRFLRWRSPPAVLWSVRNPCFISADAEPPSFGCEACAWSSSRLVVSGVAIAAISLNSGRLSLSVNRMIDVPSESVRASRPPGPLEEPMLSFPDWVLVVTTRRRTVVCRNPSTSTVVENLLGAVLLPQVSSRFFPATLLWERFRRVLGQLGLSSQRCGRPDRVD